MTFLSIYRPARLIKMLRADAQNVSRDPIMVIIVFFSFVAPVLIWFFSAELDTASRTHLGVEGMIKYVSVIAMIMPAFLIGWVTGFLLLEDRDDGPLLAMETTPIGKTGFILYRVSVSVVVCFLVTLICIAILLPEMRWMTRIYLAILVGLESTIVAFILLALARNKVEGLALSKLINIGSLIPLFAIITSPWRFMAGIFPTFWIGEFFGLSPNAVLPLTAAIIGAVMHIVWISVMIMFIRRKVG